MTIPTLDYSWPEFKDRCFDFQFYDDIFFRGQSNSEWGLRPSVARYDDLVSLDEYFDNILPIAARRLSGYANISFDIKSSDQLNLLLGLLQHHGFPTPLLDWTRSPYIAAYFAFIDYAFKKPDCDFVTIWLLNGNYVQEFLSEKEGDCPFSYIQPDSRFNQRLLAQDGLFTRSKNNEDLDVELGLLMEKHNHPGLLQKMNINVECAKTAIHDLHLMGLHPGTLFPGIDGECQSLKTKFFTPKIHEPGVSGQKWIDKMLEEFQVKK